MKVRGMMLAAAVAATACGDGKAAQKENAANGKADAVVVTKDGKPVALESAAAAKKFTAWTPIPAFLSAPVSGGSVVGDSGAIVFTKDNHVGVTTDGGASWGFVKVTTGTVRAVAGTPGGPYVVTGAGGFVSLSPDGRSWTDLPRETNEDLVAAGVGDLGVAIVGAKGAFLRLDAKGGNAALSTLPDKFKASGVRVEKDRFVVFAGKKAYESTDGLAWTPVDHVVAGSVSPTSKGLCSIGTVNKKKGVVCKVSGTAYGLENGEVLVVDKAWTALTRDAGSTWALAPLPLKGIKGVTSAGGSVHVFDGKGVIASTSNGKSWGEGSDPSVIAAAPVFPKPGKCEGRLPAAGEACQLTRETTSPADLPNVRALSFHGEVGLAMGESALVAMTADGGRTWKATSGFALGGLQGFDVRGDRVIVVGKTKTAVSTDAGKTFRTVDLPPKTASIYATKIFANGSVYLAGRGGTILKAEPDLASWTKLDTGPKNKTDFIALHEVGTVAFAAGARGELYRSADGASWMSVPTGVQQIVQKMSGEGQVVYAVTASSRYGGNRLLRSNDGGLRFFVQRELSDQGPVHDFSFEKGTLRYGNLVSSDDGATWTKGSDWYWPGSVDTADGSGIRITNIGSYYGKDRFYVIGTQKDDLTVVDSFYNNGGLFRCDATSGCWMFAGGQLYRPLPG